ncbi:MAG: DinB family protein [Candidatus Limnocylindria bacterium]|nr:DinB family protein [Chloroflexota bacterium]
MTENLSIERIADLISASGDAVARELGALGEDAGFHPASGEWCAKEVTGHIIEAERRGFAGRIRQFLAADGPDAVAWDQEAVERERRDCERSASELGDELVALRRESVALVRSLRPAELARWGTHPKVGRLTVRDLLHEWVHHDRNHARQLLAIAQERVYPHLGNSKGFVGE